MLCHHPPPSILGHPTLGRHSVSEYLLFLSLCGSAELSHELCHRLWVEEALLAENLHKPETSYNDLASWVTAFNKVSPQKFPLQTICSSCHIQ